MAKTGIVSYEIFFSVTLLDKLCHPSKCRQSKSEFWLPPIMTRNHHLGYPPSPIREWPNTWNTPNNNFKFRCNMFMNSENNQISFDV